MPSDRQSWRQAACCRIHSCGPPASDLQIDHPPHWEQAVHAGVADAQSGACQSRPQQRSNQHVAPRRGRLPHEGALRKAPWADATPRGFATLLSAIEKWCWWKANTSRPVFVFFSVAIRDCLPLRLASDLFGPLNEAHPVERFSRLRRWQPKMPPPAVGRLGYGPRSSQLTPEGQTDLSHSQLHQARLGNGFWGEGTCPAPQPRRTPPRRLPGLRASGSASGQRAAGSMVWAAATHG
jgi:hypothetical protein